MPTPLRGMSTGVNSWFLLGVCPRNSRWGVDAGVGDGVGDGVGAGVVADVGEGVGTVEGDGVGAVVVTGGRTSFFRRR